jgi:hypothetical protein
LRVLDPACGSANFLYVTLEHLKRLEGEVLDQLHAFRPGGSQQRLEAEGLTVDPHQFLGLELNPRAAAIAELVLWIGYLQWHFRTNGSGLPPQPDPQGLPQHRMPRRRAGLRWSKPSSTSAAAGQPLGRRTTKTHPVTGEQVPDETRACRCSATSTRARPSGRRRTTSSATRRSSAPAMRAALGDGYVEALRKTWPEVPESADFVMFWWHHAAQLVATGKARRFG